MVEIYRKLLDALARDEPAALCTVAQSAGSSPQKAGSKMLVYADGRIDGTIGGGAIVQKSTGHANGACDEITVLPYAFTRASAACCSTPAQPTPKPPFGTPPNRFSPPYLLVAALAWRTKWRGRNTNASERYRCTAFWGNQRLWQGS